VDAQGNPVAGAAVVLYLSPTSDKKGSTVVESQESSAVTDSNGYYELRADETSDILKEAAKNDGFATFHMLVNGDNLQYGDFFSAEFVGGAWQQAATQSVRTTLKLSRRDPRVSRVKPTRGISPLPACVPTYVTVDTWDGFGVVGEYHTVKDMSGFFKYGKTADSDLGIGTSSYVDGPFSADGSAHVGTQLGSAVRWNRGPEWSHKVRTQFHYVKRHYTSCSTNYAVLPQYWEAGTDDGADVSGDDHVCDTYPPSYTATHAPNTSYERSNNDFSSYSAAASVFGFSASSQSGASTYVVAHWDFGGNSSLAHALCGNDGAVPYAHKIFAGN
jgi:hypothetical protein